MPAVGPKVLTTLAPRGARPDDPFCPVVASGRWHFTASDSGTQVRVTVRVVGQVQEGWAELVERVWQHFLVVQYTPHVNEGRHRR